MDTILFRALLLAITFLPVSVWAAVPPGYAITDLGPVTITGGGAKDINESGQVALNLDGTAYVWDRGMRSPSGGLQNNNTSFAINDSGHLTWTSFARAQFWNGTVQTELPTLEDSLTSGWDINVHDQIVGYSYVSSLLRYRAFVWDTTGIRDLGSIAPGREARALGINDAGIIVGSVGSAQVTSLPVRWVGGAIEPLPLLPGTAMGEAWNLNEPAQIVGFTGDINGISPIATLWEADGTVRSLGRLPGDTRSLAYGINELGDVVGVSSSSVGTDPNAFLYADGRLYDLTQLLNNPNWVLEEAYGINSSGMIVGNGRFNGVTHAFVLTPMPEEGVGPIFLLAVFGLMARLKLRARDNISDQ